MQFIHRVNGDGSKTAKMIKKMIFTMLSNMTFLMIFVVFDPSPLTQFLVLIFAVLLSELCNVSYSLCNYQVYLSSFSIR